MSESVSVHPVPPRLQNGSEVPYIGPNIEAYKKAHAESIGPNADKWWGKMARETLHWDIPFHTVKSGGFEHGDVSWFPDGYVNASYNCVDRWAHRTPDKTAIIYEGDEPGQHLEISYSQLLREVSRVANVLKSWGVQPGDTVSIYLPMTWQSVAAFLACARIGAVHAVVFAGFSSESLRDRVNDCKSRVVITSDEGRRGGKTVNIKKIVDAALQDCPGVEHVLVLQRTGGEVSWTAGRDKWWHEETAKVSNFCPHALLPAEHPLFILYTSGSTGKPKGIVHTTGGYLLNAALTLKYVFDVHENDRFGCMADMGWITGHTYIVYGPLANGIATTVFESTPVYPTPARFWDVIDTHKLTHFYTAPTAVRLLRRHGEHWVEKADLSTLRVIGSVGEPINPEAWHWLNDHVGRKQAAIVDTFFQTETGTIVVAPFPGAIECKPGAATVPFLGMEAALLDPVTGKELEGNDVEGVLAFKGSWPSIARTVWQDHNRWLDAYLKPYPGYYFTGDGAHRDQDGYIWIKGRVDDVINVSGHRLSTSEIESALILHDGVAEAAVIGANDEITGQSVHAFVTLKPDFEHNGEAGLVKELAVQVRATIGPFATPKKIYLVPDLPKTRSGKIMRRIMRKVVAGEADQLGDLSTLADPSIVEVIKDKVAAAHC
ncbi:acetate--CoA ligase [Phanerochaete sordida]|uniref:Acetyl-coenzyme A synthetase n=1 Tax=Phanerochaete sordida TaxID=48140 RepID=A0A9P3LEH0_9APHY|nr:acetate--CoA ligase [Phanerochaete sordida]